MLITINTQKASKIEIDKLFKLLLNGGWDFKVDETPKTFTDIQDIVIPMVNNLVTVGIVEDCQVSDGDAESDAQNVLGKELAKHFGLDWDKLQE